MTGDAGIDNEILTAVRVIRHGIGILDLHGVIDPEVEAIIRKEMTRISIDTTQAGDAANDGQLELF